MCYSSPNCLDTFDFLKVNCCTMRWLFTMKSFRWLMAVSVSMWMVGAGCLLGCSYGASAAHTSEQVTSSSDVVVAADSCASMRSHDCCAKRKAKAPATRSEIAIPSLASMPRGMMEDCPLAVNATAVVSKAGSDMSDVGLARETWSLPVVSSNSTSHSPFVLLNPSNRGPTYLRCCVFLI